MAVDAHNWINDNEDDEEVEPQIDEEVFVIFSN